jgi:simple sugar transport system permease protein
MGEVAAAGERVPEGTVAPLLPLPGGSDRWYPVRRALEAVAAPVGAIVVASVLFSFFLLALSKSPTEFCAVVWRGAFGSVFSWQNTVARAAPLLLTALCVAVPAQLGLVVIGGEGAFVLGGLAATCAGLAAASLPAPVALLAMALAGAAAGGAWIGLTGVLRAWRGINETVASLVLAYVAIALFNHLVEGPLRDPSSLNKPSTFAIPDADVLGSLPGTGLHPGLLVGVVACVLCWVLISRTTLGFAARVAGGNLRAARLQGLPVGVLMVGACALGGAFAGLAGMIEVAAVQQRANASLIAGYGYTGILIAFLARHNPLAIVPMALLVGGIGAAGGLLQRRLGLPDATVLVLQGLVFVCVLAGETVFGRFAWFQPRLEPRGFQQGTARR